MENITTLFIIVGAVIAFVLFWIFIVWLIAQMAGWPKLVEKYPPRQPWNERCWRMQSAQLRHRANYNGVLTVCADAEGVHFATIFPFRFGNAPFSVPWGEINGRKRQYFLRTIVELQFQRAPSIPVRISVNLANRLAEASGEAWAYDDQV